MVPKLSRTALILVSLLLAPLSGAQGTEISLRKDGGLIVGGRLKALLRKNEEAVKSLGLSAPRILQKLDEQKLSLTALILPPGPTNGRYVVGLLTSLAGVPEDFETDEQHFYQLRNFLKSGKYASIDKIYASIENASLRSDWIAVESLSESLKKEIASTPIEESTSLITPGYYAGYLLAILDKTEGFRSFQDIVNIYRGEYENSLVIENYIKTLDGQEKGLAPTRITFDADVDPRYSFGDLKDDLLNSRLSVKTFNLPFATGIGKASGTGFKIWNGRDLILTTEKPGLALSSNFSMSNLAKYLDRSYGLASKSPLPSLAGRGEIRF